MAVITLGLLVLLVWVRLDLVVLGLLVVLGRSRQGGQLDRRRGGVLGGGGESATGLGWGGSDGVLDVSELVVVISGGRRRGRAMRSGDCGHGDGGERERRGRNDGCKQ
jgi:hypothetical protein